MSNNHRASPAHEGWCDHTHSEDNHRYHPRVSALAGRGHCSFLNVQQPPAPHGCGGVEAASATKAASHTQDVR